MKLHEFEDALWLPQPPPELFPFFAEAGNLQVITPPWLDFRVVGQSPGPLREGSTIDYRLRVRGLPLRWRSLIRDWNPPHRFVDEQVRGPYRCWIHNHTFEPKDGGTLVRDHVRYAVPLDLLTHRFFVRKDVERIFAFRTCKLRERFVDGSG